VYRYLIYPEIQMDSWRIYSATRESPKPPPILKTPCIVLFVLLFSIIALSSVALRADAEYSVFAPTHPVQVILSGVAGHRPWSYTVPFPVQNTATLETLVSCESQGVNVSRPDSNHLVSDGILQFNRGPSDLLGSGTWADMEKRFHFYGSPIYPADAIHMADLMISNGYLARWSCARITRLIN
jgi:hypothetical protein